MDAQPGEAAGDGDRIPGGTVRCRIYRIDQFYRWSKDRRSFTTSATYADADEDIQGPAYTDESWAHEQNVVKAIKSLFAWEYHEQVVDLWQRDIQFYGGDGASQPNDFSTGDDRSPLREAALSYGIVPHFDSLSSDDRREWKRLLAQRFGVPMSEVGRAEFERANGYEVPSPVYPGLDAGLRPVEVKRSTMLWVDVDNAVLRVPAEGEEHCAVSVRLNTAELLRRGRRDGRGYSIRHSVETYVIREGDLAAAGIQLRHRSPQTTMADDDISIEDRRDALDRMR